MGYGGRSPYVLRRRDDVYNFEQPQPRPQAASERQAGLSGQTRLQEVDKYLPEREPCVTLRRSQGVAMGVKRRLPLMPAWPLPSPAPEQECMHYALREQQG